MRSVIPRAPENSIFTVPTGREQDPKGCTPQVIKPQAANKA